MSEKEQLLEIYKIHVEMIDRVSQRRGQLNQFYITVLSGLLGVLALSAEKELTTYKGLIFMLIGTLGLFLCVLWLIKLQSYKQLNSAKFKVIFLIEKELIFRFYEEEWNILKISKNYRTITNLEKISPVLLALLFTFLILCGLSM